HETQIIGQNVANLHAGPRYIQLQEIDRRFLTEDAGTGEYAFTVERGGEVRRKLAAWSTVYLGDQRLTIALSAPDTEISLFLENTRRQSLLMGVILLCVLAITSILFFSWQQNDLQRLVHERTNALEAEVERRTQAESALRERNTYLVALHDTTLAILNHTATTDILDVVLQHAATLAEAPFGTIDIFYPEKGYAETKANTYTSDRASTYSQLGSHWSMEEGILGEVYRLGIPVVVDDYDTWTKRLPNYTYSGLFSAVLGLPLKSGPQVIGMLSLGHHAPDRKFSPEQVDVLERFAALASMVLENARLLEESQQQLRERIQAEKIIHAEKERYRSLFERTNDAIFLFGLDLIIFDVNQQAADMLGYTREEMIGRSSLDFTLLDEHSDSESRKTALMAGQKQPVYERSFIHRDGRILTCELNVSVVYDEEGNPAHFNSVIRDITERKTFETALTAERNLLKTVINSLPDFIFVKDREGRFITVNETGTRGRGRSRMEEVIGKTDFDFVPADVARRYRDGERLVMESGIPQLNVEEQVDWEPATRILGDVRWFLTTKVPLRDQNGQIIGLVGISRDITPLKRAEQDALRLMLEKERVKMLSDFVMALSHDFRTPLATINTSAYLMERAEDKEKRASHARQIADQVKRITLLVDGLLTMSRLDSVNELECHPLPINPIIQNIITAMQEMVAEKHLTLRVELGENLPPVSVEAYELHLALTEIVKNAMLYTPPGGTVALRTTANFEWVTIEISDTGIGMSREEIQHIFERLYRAEPSRSIYTGGIGLGLSIVQRIIELHRGVIEIESMPGQGSIFFVRLPLVSERVSVLL
ncbi:MAG: PAS domain S-box protein, partial [Anaerolineae bacterium]|nr:PAS domain S-box protein [Anaerolineae bacterium]